MESSLSDHKQLFLEVGKLTPVLNKRVQYAALDYDKLYENSVKSIDSVEDDYCSLEKHILENIELAKVMKTKVLNPPQKDWINKDILNKINLRNHLWKETKRKPTDENTKKLFEKERDGVQSMIKNTKKDYYHRLFHETYNKPKKMWELINTLAVNKVKNSCAPPNLVSNSNLITDGTEICNLFNSFFSSIGADLANKIPNEYHTNTENILMYGHNYVHDVTLNELKPCSANEIRMIIDNLDTNASAGIDGISTKAIKCLKELIVEKLVITINKCFKAGIFPDSLKVAKVNPIYKAASRSDSSNYRPISVLPVISKIFERLLYNRLSDHLTQKEFVIEEQYGFRPKSSTLTAAIDLVTKIKTQIDKKDIALGIFVDLKKAFDTILTKTIKSNLVLNIKTNKHNLRKQNKLKLITPRTNYGRKTILFEGVQLYNNLPESIKKCKSVETFKSKLKIHITASSDD
ncbi:hypothetical protein ABMA27_016975 [Loxostege sticticalis]|uniref:Reverse transcriptase domain-containing protein n=1 Tax=Loxostege sticticalis TaxID=481309 RepID=A0ABR3GYH8_LOXSC